MMLHTKNPYKNLYALLKKTLFQVFIIVTILCSCNNEHQDLSPSKNEYDLGFVFSDDQQSQKFYTKVNFKLSNSFTEEIPHHAQLPKCCHCPRVARNIKNAFLICLVPGFKVEDIDPYSPRVAQMLKDLIIGKFKGKEDQVCVETKIFSRWGNFSPDNRDNETFQTQYFILRNQLDLQIKKLQERYTNAQVHVVFIGESYGGKMSLFFLDQLLKNFKTPKVSFDMLITIHSPLYKMQMPSYALNSTFLKSPTAQTLTSFFNVLDYLNVKDYRTTFKILSSEYINDVTTTEALENLQGKNIKIFNFIGTPKEIHLGDKHTTFESFAKSFLDKLDAINWGFKLTLQSSIDENDSLITFLKDKDYYNNSDFVVKTSEVTKDKTLIENIKSNRDRFQIYQTEGMTFFISPHIIHLGDVFNIDLFEKDLQNKDLLAQLNEALRF